MGSRRSVLWAALLVVALAAPAGAGNPQPARVQSRQYLYPHGVDTWHWTVSAGDALPAAVFEPRPGDSQMHLKVEDVSGQPVFVHVRQEGDPGEDDLFDHFCDTADIVYLVSDKPVQVYVFSGACQNHTTGLGTTGTLTATFARRL